MFDELIWKKINEKNPKEFQIGLTDKAFEMLGQIWAIIPVNERKKNYNENDALFTIEGSDSLTTISAPFNIKKLNYTSQTLDRPDQLNSSTPLIFAEV
jgi:glycine cleavage system H lipoate-binding protein